LSKDPPFIMMMSAFIHENHFFIICWHHQN